MPLVEADENGEPYQVGVYCSECYNGEVYEPHYCSCCGADMSHVDRIYYTVECPKCYVNMGEYESVEEMIEAWNRRAKNEDD